MDYGNITIKYGCYDVRQCELRSQRLARAIFS